ncbi:hypothetical protein C8E03_102571 [Lachnotalea glycerini]|uniref:Uncharacterized protein n=1 Tax=Lachnotalea glycerini TaxID=1763509 RepID=A0A318ES15_9FIRM|nr:hypothetical protein C8E03_102571 [Lachnotalea glycerini]
MIMVVAKKQTLIEHVSNRKTIKMRRRGTHENQKSCNLCKGINRT